jgi:transcriptional regulator of acetoin/glycerol metabolism
MEIDPELKRAPKINEEEFLIICQKRKNLLLQVSVPIISKFTAFFDYTQSAIVITDENGTILYVAGNEELKKEGSIYGYDVGTRWSEECAGTNAIGTCLTLAQPVAVVGDEHYVKIWRKYGCAASPIRDPFSGEIIGSFNISCRLENFHVFSLCIVEMLSEIIESTLRNISNTRVYSRQGLIMDKFLETSKEADLNDGIIAIDLEGNILASNKAIHSIIESDKNMPLKNLFEFYPAVQEMLDSSVDAPITFSTKLHGRINENNSYLANFIPIFSNDSRLEGWLGRVFKIPSGDISRRDKSDRNPLQPIYVSLSMSKVINKARKVASFASTKLILGESGVGKEILARFIHANGTRASQPFIALNCAALPKELLASELFGYDSGAFTGARIKGKPGKFQMANRGTIYLDEIGDMPIELQSYLLRVIEEKKISRLGGTDNIPIDVQIIASTNRDLKRLVKENKFRLDLYYRLNVININIPPLRERKEDILPLAEFFLEKVANKLDGISKRLSSHAKEALLKYNWPGNIRELEHTIEMAHAISDGEIIGLEDLQEEILAGTSYFEEKLSSEQTYSEEDKIIKAIRMCKGNMSKVADTLHISRTTLYRKMTKYGIPLKTGGSN